MVSPNWRHFPPKSWIRCAWLGKAFSKTACVHANGHTYLWTSYEGLPYLTVVFQETIQVAKSSPSGFLVLHSWLVLLLKPTREAFPWLLLAQYDPGWFPLALGGFYSKCLLIKATAKSPTGHSSSCILLPQPCLELNWQPYLFAPRSFYRRQHKVVKRTDIRTWQTWTGIRFWDWIAIWPWYITSTLSLSDLLREPVCGWAFSYLSHRTGRGTCKFTFSPSQVAAAQGPE